MEAPQSTMMKSILALAVPASLLLAAAPQQAGSFQGVSLPFAAYAQQDFGLIVNVDAAGRIHANGQVRFEPGGDRKKFEGWLAARAKEMDAATGTDLPGERVLLSVDVNAPFSAVQKLMQSCAMPNVQLWRLEIAAQLWGGLGAGSIPVHLPIDLDMPEEIEEGVERSAEPVEDLEVRIDVVEPGERRSRENPELPWEGTGPCHYVGRVVQYQMGPYRTRNIGDLEQRLPIMAKGLDTKSLRIDARRGTTHDEVVRVLDLGLASGCDQFTFTGAFD